MIKTQSPGSIYEVIPREECVDRRQNTGASVTAMISTPRSDSLRGFFARILCANNPQIIPKFFEIICGLFAY